MKKIKIVIITNNYKPYNGGVVSSIETFSQELIRLGHEVFIITLDFATNEIDHDYVIRLDCPIKFKYKKYPIAIPWRYDHQIIKLINKINPDIIHSQHPFFLGASALKASKKLNIPIIFTYHSMYEQYAHNVPIPTLISEPIIKKFALGYCKNVDHVISPTESTKNFLLKNGIKTNISIIPSGINSIFLSKDYKRDNSNQIKLLSVSRFTKEKNIPFLLEVFSKLDNNFILNLVGHGVELENLQNYAFNILNIENNRLNFVVNPEKNEIAQFYRDSDIFIFASTSETQGLVLAEAMAGGLPVIALNASGSSDIIINNHNGFLVENQSEMLEKIKLIRDNKKLKENLHFNAWQTGQKYSVQEATRKLIDLFGKLLVSFDKLRTSGRSW
ncbi:hypothetical protein A3F66_04550 [candidate division TM6 bacterium RIFCSPHIGHO2_12_FULL_32_22]|nr:MAG: hypothetical protein A3F66_04550 [candidate division TM6 bacterium RIFCSPHIGHO2_12_FULL_32_22]